MGNSSLADRYSLHHVLFFLWEIKHSVIGRSQDRPLPPLFESLLIVRMVVSNTYCVVFFFCFSSYCVPNEVVPNAVVPYDVVTYDVFSFFGLSMYDCPFGIR
jgi:hypothetical protein